MKKISFNTGWTCNGTPVTLPHDAQITEPRSAGASDGGHAYFPGGLYRYEKKFTVPADWVGKTVLLQFEGVYKNASVFVNGVLAVSHPYGYTGFFVPLEALTAGEELTLTVVADNTRLPNSRWYTGAGIYRPVWVYVGPENAILPESVRITTLSVEPAAIRVECPGVCTVKVYDGETEVAGGEGASVELTIPDAKLWSAETPYLYTCLVSNGEDEVCETFGIRQIRWNPKGLFINGKETLLRGGCVHHDSGILGAATYAESEERRVRILKENGFNAIRSSHNPASTALLSACDRLGMYVMDETFDMWYNRKTKFDYGCDWEENWPADITAMVSRDFNHPSVILYSIGNEVGEPGEPKGLKAAQDQIDLFHKLDASRPVTAGANLMIIGRTAKGNALYQNGQQAVSSSDKPSKDDDGTPKNASLAFNMMAAFMGPGMNKSGNSKKIDEITTPFLDALDIAGYNYASGRYPLEGKAHPGRVLFGSETFPQDIGKNWDMVKKYPYLVGDFMWTSWDYLGEAGIGAWSYTGGMPFNRPFPWILAGAGVIDITGTPDGSCAYTGVVWGTRPSPAIAVRPVNHPGVRVSKSVWRGTNAIPSWSFVGCAGNKATVEVYADAAAAELFLNGRSLGKKKIRNYQALWTVRYEAGTLSAAAYDAAGREIGQCALTSAGFAEARVMPEKQTAAPGEVLFVPVVIADETGNVECNADRKLSVTVEGGELLAFGAANPCTEETYHSGTFTTYYGRALAVVRAGEAGTVTVTAHDGGKTAAASIAIG